MRRSGLRQGRGAGRPVLADPVVWIVVGGLTGVSGGPLRLHAQEAPSRCTMQVVTPPGANSVSESVEGIPGAYVTYVGGGDVTVRCGDATMVSDSAVNYDHLVQAVMIGNVRYTDTTRVMDAGRVTYFGPRDLVVAEEDVTLVTRRSGARLEGPRVEFLRTPLRGSRTVATGRPRMILPTGTGGPGTEPFVVDADVAEFHGQEETFARGDVEIRRADLNATADSATFRADGRGVLYGDPVVWGEDYRMTGDSIVAQFTAGQLDDVHALGTATTTGNGFDLRSEEIRVRLDQRQIQRLWAFGPGRSVASSGRFRLAGDSLDFVFTDGTVDSIAAVGSATSVETTGVVTGALEELELSTKVGSNWMAGDTIRAQFAAPPADSEENPEPALDRLVALGNARSFYGAVRDSARTQEPSRNYLLGVQIEIRFENGEPAEVRGYDAIGVYLEPVAEGEGR